MSTGTKAQTTNVLRVTPEQAAARRPLIDAGNRILELIHRIGDQATEEQVREHMRQHRALCVIWNNALMEPIENG